MVNKIRRSLGGFLVGCILYLSRVGIMLSCKMGRRDCGPRVALVALAKQTNQRIISKLILWHCYL